MTPADAPRESLTTELVGNLRCQSCIHFRRKCWIRQASQSCIHCDEGGSQCLFTRSVTRPGQFYGWEELTVVGTPAPTQLPE